MKVEVNMSSILTKQDNLDFQFAIYTKAQAKAIEVAKWIEGEKIRSDPGKNYIRQWIKNFAKDYKNSWKISKCKYCKNEHCRYKATNCCDDFIPDPKLVESNDYTRPQSNK